MYGWYTNFDLLKADIVYRRIIALCIDWRDEEDERKERGKVTKAERRRYLDRITAATTVAGALRDVVCAAIPVGTTVPSLSIFAFSRLET